MSKDKHRYAALMLHEGPWLVNRYAIGYLPVYESLDELRKDHPSCQFVEIEPKPKNLARAIRAKRKRCEPRTQTTNFEKRKRKKKHMSEFKLEPEQPPRTLTFLGEEIRHLRLNIPLKGSANGGWQRLENRILQETNADTGDCIFSAKQLDQLKHYLTHYGPGGPNERLRKACVPALHRIGIDIDLQ